VIELVMVQPEAVHEENRVIFGGVEVAVGDVGDLEVLDDATTFQRKVPEVRDLVRRLIRPVCQCRRGMRQE
jgi:hypothetical protein